MNPADILTTSETRALAQARPDLGAKAIELVREMVRFAERSSHQAVTTAVAFLNEVRTAEAGAPVGSTGGLRPAVGAKHTYDLEAGRCITRDGAPFVSIRRQEDPTKPYVNPSDVDAFARLCSAASDMHAALIRNREGLVCRVNTGAEVGRADCDCFGCELARETDAALRKAEWKA